MWEQILPGLRIKIFMTVVLGVIYPLAMTGISQIIFPKQANGSLVKAGEKVIGSELIGQNFSKPEYFHPRPSSAGSGYDPTASSGSNLGPTSAKLIHGTTKMDDKKNEVVDFDGISLRLVHFCVENDIPYDSSVPLDRFKDAKGELDDVKLIKAFNDDKAPLVFTPKVPIPADAVTASASGLDPHISPASAHAQASRIAKARAVSPDQINQLIAQFTEGPGLGLLGEARVNVLLLNLALDQRLACETIVSVKREIRRKTPEELLRECQAEEAAAKKGHLKIFLGYASGVGKSFRMLDEARRRRERGQDVVVGAIQPRVSPDIEPLLKNLEVIPLKRVDNGAAIDLEALIRRHPVVCFIDGLAYNNPPGSRNPTRWQDVQDLLNAGIKVIASINIQYIAEMRKDVEAITGKHVTETVPVSFIKSADEIEIVDAPPEEPLERSPEEQAEAQKREQRLSRLRELALVLAADVVDHQLNEYLECHGLKQQFGANERILVCITPRANIQEMMEIAQIIAQRFHGELIVAYVNQPNLSSADQAALDARLAIASAAGAHIEILGGDDPAEALLEFAKSRGITQLFVGHSQRTGLSRLWGSPIEKLIRDSRGMDVRVFPQ